MTIVLEANSSYMHTEEVPEKTPEEVILLHELPLKTWITWTRWWHLTGKALPLVTIQEEGLWSCWGLLEERDT